MPGSHHPNPTDQQQKTAGTPPSHDPQPAADTPPASTNPSGSTTPKASTALQQTQAAIDPEQPSAALLPLAQQQQQQQNHAPSPPVDLPSKSPVLPSTVTTNDSGLALTLRSSAVNAKPVTRTTAYPPLARPPKHPWGKEHDSRRLRRTLKNLYRLLRSLPLPLHRLIPKFLARAISRVLSHRYIRRMPTDIAFDIALFFWTMIVSIFFRVVQARGAWRIPKQKDGPVIFVAAPHHNQFLDPLLLMSEVRRASGRRVAFLIAEKSIKRKFVGAAARVMQSIPVARAADSAKAGSGLITAHPDDPCILLGLNTRFTKEVVPKGQIQLPKFTGHFAVEVVEVISDTEVRIKKAVTNDKAKAALRGEVPPPPPGAPNQPNTDKARAAAAKDAKDVGEWEGQRGCKYKTLPFIDQTMMYASVYKRLAEGGSLGIFPEGGSHDRTDLLPLKAGVVIMALGAMAENPGLKVRIVPVGMHYFHADKFRSRAVIEFGAPMEVSPESVAMFKEGGDGKKKAVGQCMDLVFDGLKSVTVRAPDYETLMFIQAGRRLYTPPGSNTSLGQVVELNRRFIMGYNKFKDEPRVIALKADVQKYNRMLMNYGLRDHQVERAHRAGWRSLGLLLYRTGLLFIWSSLALPGVVLNAPIFILAKIISRHKAKEALAASQVKIQGRDVLATWKVLVSLGVTPVLYTFYAVIATMYARKQGWITTWRAALGTPLMTYIALPLMSYSALKVGENSIDIYKSLPPLVVSLIPGNHKAIKRLQEMRTRLSADLHRLIDELAPQVFEDFDSFRLLHPAVSSAPRSGMARKDSSASASASSLATAAATTAPPPPRGRAAETTDTETGTETENETDHDEHEAGFWKRKSDVVGSGGKTVDVLSQPLAWADEKIFGWGRDRPAGVNRSRPRPVARSSSRRSKGRDAGGGGAAGGGSTEDGQLRPLLPGKRASTLEDDEQTDGEYGSAEEGDREEGEEEEGSDDYEDAEDEEEEQEEGDYEAIFRMLSPGNILSAVNKSTDGKVGGGSESAPLPRGAGRRNRSRSRSQSGWQQQQAGRRVGSGGSQGSGGAGAADDGFATPGPGELSFREKRNKSTDSLATLGQGGGGRRGTRSPGWITPTSAGADAAGNLGLSISRPSSRGAPAMMSPITRTTALPDPDAPLSSSSGGAGAADANGNGNVFTRRRTVSATSSNGGRRARTHSLREAVPVEQMASGADDTLPASSDERGNHHSNSLLFTDAARKLEAEVRQRGSSPEDKRKARPDLAAMKSAEATPRGAGSPFFSQASDGAAKDNSSGKTSGAP
ncbi:hypothetical protein V8E36_007720 [Tilletia maclaganii]